MLAMKQVAADLEEQTPPERSLLAVVQVQGNYKGFSVHFRHYSVT
jgi:hypothetical protein